MFLVFILCAIWLWFDESPFLTKVTIFIIIITICIYYINASLCDVQYCDHVDDLLNGTIPRTPLLQQGETIKDLPHGVYRVTGGVVHIGNLGNGHVTKIIGIAAQGVTGLTYTPGTQPYNRNFASILFELREAGQTNVSHSALDSVLANNRQLATPNGNFNANFLQSYRVFAGMAQSQYGDTSITNRIINGIAL